MRQSHRQENLVDEAALRGPLAQVRKAHRDVGRRVGHQPNLVHRRQDIARLLLRPRHVDGQNDRVDEDPVRRQAGFHALRENLRGNFDAAVHVLRDASGIHRQGDEAPARLLGHRDVLGQHLGVALLRERRGIQKHPPARVADRQARADDVGFLAVQTQGRRHRLLGDLDEPLDRPFLVGRGRADVDVQVRRARFRLAAREVGDRGRILRRNRLLHVRKHSVDAFTDSDHGDLLYASTFRVQPSGPGSIFPSVGATRRRPTRCQCRP